MDLSGFPTLLDQAFLEYRIRQTRQRLSVSLNSFASYLEFSPTIVNTWLNGKKQPSTGNLDRMIPKMVELLGPEVYDSLDIPRPDTDLQRLTESWSSIPAQLRHMLADLAEKYAAETELSDIGTGSVGESAGSSVTESDDPESGKTGSGAIGSAQAEPELPSPKSLKSLPPEES